MYLHMQKFLSIPVLCAVVCGGAAQAATLAHRSDFDSGGKDGWQHPVPSGNQTSVQMESPSNNILLVTSSGGSGAGSRLVVPNSTSAWTGDYTAAGITGVRVDLVNNSGLTLSMRVGIEGAGGSPNRWVSASPVTLSPSDRGTFLFQLDSGSMTSAGGGDFLSAMANVTQIRILHNATAGDFKGAKVSGSFTADNITLVPEPSSAAMVLLAGAAALLARKR